MPRAAGNSSHYTFRLFNESTGKYETDCEIKLASVTTVIGAVLAKPQLVGWAYRQTTDSVAALVTELKGRGEEEDSEVLELLSDAGMLDEYLRENKMRPDDMKFEASKRGIRAHTYLENLAELSLTNATLALSQANRDCTARDPYNRAIATWWSHNFPRVHSSELKLWSLEHGFMGTTDLLWYDNEGLLHCTDLKTRKAGGSVYDSDLIQGGAYKIAFEEMYGQEVDVVDVLLAREDGSYQCTPSTYAPDLFLMLLSTYNALKEVN